MIEKGFVNMKNNDKLILLKTLTDLKSVLGIKYDRELADKLGISGPNFSARKKRGSLLLLINDYIRNNNINITHIVSNDSKPLDLTISAQDAAQRVSAAITMTLRILNSETSYSDALYLNIVHFDRAIQAERQQNEHTNRIAELERKMSVLSKELAEKIGALQEENNKLKNILATKGYVYQHETGSITPKKTEKN